MLRSALRVLRSALALGLVAALMILAGSYAGRLHPVGDSLAVFRPLWALGVVALAPLALPWRRAVPVVLVALAALAPIWWATRPAVPAVTPPDAITIYQKNLLHRLTFPHVTAEGLRQVHPDIVLLQELSPQNMEIVDSLRDLYPTQAICPGRKVGAVAVLSRFPAAGPALCDGDNAMIAQPLETPLGPVTAVSLHLHWPYPYRQAEQVDAVLPQLRQLSRPVVVSGDFNMVPWSAAVARIAAATGTVRPRPVQSTRALKRYYPLHIDHVLTPAGWAAALSVQPSYGSDHRGLLATTGPRD